MKMSFRYKFILSFVTIEIIFISLIVFFNFSSLDNLSKDLINEKIETSGKLFTELVKVPLILDDLATLDNAAESFTNMKNVMEVKIINSNHQLISHCDNKSYIYENICRNDVPEAIADGRTFRLSVLPIKIDNELLGTAEIVFEITDSLKTIELNRKLTLVLVLVEILLSMTIAYVIGVRLTRALNILTLSAEQIAKDDQAKIPNTKSEGDEISVLSHALYTMQQKIAKRNKHLNQLLHEVQDSSELLIKERDFYTTLLDNTSSVILVMNVKGEIILSNKTVEKFTGYTQDELKGKVAWEVFVPEEIQSKVKSIFLKLVAGDFPSTHENTWLVKDGSTIPFAWSNSCILDEDGNIKYIITVGVDITQRKAEQTIRALLNSPTDSIILIAIDGTIVEINNIAANRFHNTAEILKGKNIFYCCPEDFLPLSEDNLHEVVISKKAISFEKVVNGSLFKNHLYPIIDTNGNVVQLSLFSHDITLQRERQEELQKYIKLVDENVLSSRTDLKGLITSVSQAYCNISGYSSDELIGHNYNFVRDENTPKSLYEDMWDTIQSGKIWHGEIRNKAKDGHYYWIEATIYPDFDKNGQIIAYNSIRQDITNKKLIEELSITDPLTQLYNRRQFDDIFDRELNGVRRDKKIFCLMSLDVDNFKLYNDTYGHQMGDEVLFTIASTLKDNMKRATDFPFRMGGEEFSVIYKVEDEKNVYEVADSIRKYIEDKKIEHKLNTAISPYVTVSIGVVFINFEKNEKLKTTKNKLYKKADDLLYKAKGNGRNNVVVEEYK